MEHKKYHHGDLRNSLIEAGIELINERGLKEFSLRKVSALCGVSQAAPYSHFKSKEELLEAMQEHVTKQFMEVLENSIKEYSDKKDPRVLIEMGKSYVMFFINNPQYFSFLFSQPVMKINLSLNSDENSNFPPYELFKSATNSFFEDSGMSEEEMEDEIIYLWATVHGLTSIATMKNVYYDKDWELKIEDIIWNKKK